MKNIKNSELLFEKAQKYIPGGVNSPVRAFKSVGGNPIFIQSAQGAYLMDEDNNSYVDCINSWGPMLLGHANPIIEKAVYEALKNSPSFGTPTRREVEMAELITQMMPSVEKVRMVNSGTEATMSAIRLARAFTKRSKILKFEGCYHGHCDSFLIAAGSGVATLGIPDSPGVTESTAKDTLTAIYNDISSVENLIKQFPGQIAGIIIEPVVGNMGLVLPKENFLQKIRQLCDKEGIVLIFDEVMTGFRLAKGGAQELFGVVPDLTTLGKIIGGGLPVGAYGGRKEIMDWVAPLGPMYQAGTLSGNPMAMAAGLAMLTYLNENPKVYENLAKITEKIVLGMKEILAQKNKKYTINHIGSMFSIFFTESEVYNFSTAKKSDTQAFRIYFHHMLSQGIYLAPSQFESLFISTAITDKEVKKILEAFEKSIL